MLDLFLIIMVKNSFIKQEHKYLRICSLNKKAKIIKKWGSLHPKTQSEVLPQYKKSLK
jgi:hypothetical protein